MTDDKPTRDDAAREYQKYLKQLNRAFETGDALLLPYAQSGPLMKCVLCARSASRSEPPLFSAIVKIPKVMLPRVLQPVENRPFAIKVTSYQSNPLEQPDGTTQSTSKVTMEVYYPEEEEAEALGKTMSLATRTETDEKEAELVEAIHALEERGELVLTRKPEECN